MKILLSFLLITTLASSTISTGVLNGGHFAPATNIVSSRTIVGTAVGGGPTSGAVSTAQYSQTVPAPATVQTIITSHPSPAVGYTTAPSGVPAAHSGGSFTYTSIPQGAAGSVAPGGYGRPDGSHGGSVSPNPGYNQPHLPYYNQRYY